MNDASHGDIGADSVWALAPAERADVTMSRPGLGRLLGHCPAMLRVIDQIRRVAPTRVSVLLTGESGTGKELVAQTLHRRSGRKHEPFLAVNCGAIPATLVEAELFGHERGSYTGAVRSQAGYFERAGSGTLLLDEVSEMPLEMQVKLLRALESQRIQRIGGDHEIPVRARIIAAMNRPPAEAVAGGKLRADLLYRLAVFHIDVPPLRERDTDIDLLARQSLGALNRRERTDKRLSFDSILFLHEYGWPGNVRELHNLIQRAFIMADTELDLRAANSSSPNSAPGVAPTAADQRGALTVRPGATLAEVERLMIVATLEHCAGNKTRTAAVLGISLKTLYNRLNEYRATPACGPPA